MRKNTGKRTDTIRGFWNWFAANVRKLELLYQQGSIEELTRELGREIDRIDPQLAWEMGPGTREVYLLTISSEGNHKLRRVAESVLKLAPRMSGWEFYSSKPARHPPDIVRLPERAEAFRTTQWNFVPVEHLDTGRLDLLIVDDCLVKSDREAAMKAVSIYLDQYLGEATVETWIGEFEVISQSNAAGKTTYPISELRDYLEWATNRKDNPLRRKDLQ